MSGPLNPPAAPRPANDGTAAGPLVGAMTLYDATIRRVQALLAGGPAKPLPCADTDWPEVTDRSMILRGEMAYELGSEGRPAIGCTLVTADPALVPNDSLTLLGPDLPQLTAREDGIPYARVALVRAAAGAMGEGQALYSAVRALEYTRYHVYPEGFMLRVSAARRTETVRVSRAALAKGLDFARAGSRMIAAFHRSKAVEAVQLWVVTLPGFDYAALDACAREGEAITKTIDHILKNAVMDCSACSLQLVCDEVEGLRQLHFLGRG